MFFFFQKRKLHVEENRPKRELFNKKIVSRFVSFNFKNPGLKMIDIKLMFYGFQK